MLFVVVCRDSEPGSARRQEALSAHRDYVDSQREHLVISGPLLDSDGETHRGQLFVVDFPDRAAALAFANADPFVRAGIFDSVDINGFRLVFQDGQRV